MSSGGKGGSQTTDMSIPPWMEGGMQRNLQRGEDFARVAPMIHHGPSVAALTEGQMAGIDNAGAGASAFGLAAPSGSVRDRLPAPTDFGGGLLGYSTGGLAEAAYNEWAGRNPESADLYGRNYGMGGGQAGQGFAALSGDPVPVGGDFQYGMQAPPGYTSSPGKGGMGSPEVTPQMKRGMA